MTQAMSGLMSVTGPKDGPPYRLPIAISDVAAGCYLTIGVLAALEARHRTGRGQMVETSLLEATVSFGVYEAANYFATGERPPRLGQAHRGNSPYQVFQTRDGWITIGGAQQNFWMKLCRMIGQARPARRSALHDQCAARRRTTRRSSTSSRRGSRREPTAHWLALLREAGIPAGPVLTHDEVFGDPADPGARHGG